MALKFLFAFTFLFSLSAAWAVPACPTDARYGLVVHGGAGGWQVTDEQKEKVRRKIEELLFAGQTRLKEGDSSLDTVQLAVQIMEDSGLLNAGKGGVANKDKVVELDASIMDGHTGKGGAVGGVKTLKNPVQAARLVMEKTKHVLLVAEGAEKFAASEGAMTVPSSYFINNVSENPMPTEHGTVGAVALDCHGNLAAATSTGGLKGKLPGRLGDSPILGAGTYADNTSVAVSGTGTGEYFIRGVIAYDVSALMAYQRLNLADATKRVMAKLTAKGGDGGIIAIDAQGNVAMPFNTQGMLRGHINETGKYMIDFH